MKENTFSAVTDIDSRLLRTIFLLFRSPSTVINDNHDRFTPPVRYILTITGLVFFLYLFIDSFLDTSDMSITHWRTPLREQLYLENLENISSKFSTFIFSISLVPGIWLASTLLFFRKGNILFFYRVTLYFIAQATIVGLVLTIPTVWLNADLSFLFMLLLMGFTVYFFLSLSFNRWYIVLPKVLILLPVALLSYSSLSPVITTLIRGIMIHPTKTYDVPLTSDALFSKRTNLDDNVSGFAAAAIDGQRLFFIDAEHRSVGMLSEEGDIVWSKTDTEGPEPRVRMQKIIPVPKHNLLLLFGDSLTQSPTDFLVVLNYAGEVLLRHRFSEDLMTDAFQLNDIDSSGMKLLIPYSVTSTGPYVFQEGIISLPELQFSVMSAFTTSYPVYQLYPAGKSGTVASVVKKDRQYAEFGIARYDTANNLLWYQQTFDKSVPYDPPVPQTVAIDTSRKEILIHYSLANDTTDYAYLRCLDLITGTFKWENSFLIPGDYTEYVNMVVDNSYIYLSGETHRNVVRLFRSDYHAAMIACADRNTGELLDYKHFGNSSYGGHSRFSHMFQTDMDLILYGTENNAAWFRFGETSDGNYRWVLPKKAVHN